MNATIFPNGKISVIINVNIAVIIITKKAFSIELLPPKKLTAKWRGRAEITIIRNMMKIDHSPDSNDAIVSR